MQQYVCVHCGAVLGPFVVDEPEPTCSAHPHGPRELVEIAAEATDGDS